MKNPFKNSSATLVLPFFLIHSAVFYLVFYSIAQTRPTTAFLGALFATTVYSTFYYLLFEKGYQSAFISAAISITTGLIFGDWLLQAFYSESLLTNNWHTAFMILVVHNIYLFIDLVKYLFKPNKPHLGDDDKKRQKLALWGSLAALSFLGITYVIHIFDFNNVIQERLAGQSTYQDKQLEFKVSFPIVEMRQVWSVKSPSIFSEIPGFTIRFYWDASKTRWAEQSFDPFLIQAIPLEWWAKNKTTFGSTKEFYWKNTDETEEYVGQYLGENDRFVFFGQRGPECPSIDTISKEIIDSKLCMLNQRSVEEIFKDFFVST